MNTATLTQNDEFDKKLSYEDLSDEEKAVIIRRYGAQPGWSNRDTDRLSSFDALVQNQDFSLRRGAGAYYAHPVVGIKTLTRSETWFFEHQGFVSPHFCVQMLYKVKGDFSRSEFCRAFYKFITDTPALCVNFCPVPKRILKIVSKGVLPNIDYRNIEHMPPESVERTLGHIMKKETERGFDLLRGALLRLHIIRTDNDEYAVILTQSHLLVDAWNPQQFFLSAFHGNDSAAKEKISFTDFLEKRDIENTSTPSVLLQDAMADTYWRGLLKNLPPAPTIQGWHQSSRDFEQKIFKKKFAADLIKLLNERANRNKGQFIAILQTAWGIFLHGETHIKDTFFASVMPEPHARAANAVQTSAVLNPMIIRLQTPDTAKKIKDIVEEHFRQILTSQSFVNVYIGNLLELLDIAPKVFTHFLSFHGFMTDAVPYGSCPATEEGRCLSVDSWDSRGMDLGVYFRFEQERITMTLRYNNAAFNYADIDDVFRRYEKILNTLLIDWDEPLYEFWEHYDNDINYVRRKNLSNIRSQKAAAYFRGLPLFKDVPDKIINNLAAATETYTCIRNDALPSSDGNLLFISWGSVSRNLEFADGRKKKLDIGKGKMWLNETAVFDEANAAVTIAIEQSPVTIIALPFPVLEEQKELTAKFREYAEQKLKGYDKEILAKTNEDHEENDE